MSTLFTLLDSSSDSDVPFSDEKQLNMKIISTICAISSPIVNGVVNLLDKVVISGRVHHTGSYIAVIGFLDVIIGIIIGCCGDWSKEAMSGLTWVDFLMPILSGVSLGLYTIFYFFAIEWAEASKVAGIESIYPLFVALWSFIFLHETIQPMTYLGIALAVIGGCVLSSDALKIIYKTVLRNTESCSARNAEFLEKERATEEEVREEEAKKMQTKGYGEWWYPFKKRCAQDKEVSKVGEGEQDPLLGEQGENEDDEYTEISVNGNIQEETGNGEETASRGKYLRKIILGVLPIPILMSGNDFFAKISVGNLHRNNVSGLNSLGLGAVLVCMLFRKDVREHYLDELKFNWFFCAIIEVMSISATYLIICGMIGLEAPIVSSLTASRPLFVLIFETIFRVSKVPVSHCFGFKLLPILCVIAGTIIMSVYA